jgi:dinuclear metal center YbgI/SA1388 family protein
MSLLISDVLDALTRLASFDKAADWDPVGLQVGDPAKRVGRIAVCHEVTQGLVAGIIDLGPSLVVTYHPLIFRPLHSLVAGPHAAGRALRLAEAGVALATVHTGFDVAPGGTADALAAVLRLDEVVGFGPVTGRPRIKVVAFVPEEAVDEAAGAMAEAGAGRIGNYTNCSFRSAGHGTFFAGEGTAPAAGSAGALNREPEVRLEMVAPAAQQAAVVAALVGAHPYEEPAYDVYDVRGSEGMIGRIGAVEPLTLGELTTTVETALDTSARVAGALDGRVGRVAVVPGSGADFIADARRAGADVLVTGDVSHHRAREAQEGGLAIIDAGHGPTERPGVRALYAAVAGITADAIDLTGIDDSPWEAR